ncbi:MAG: HD domain-containing phosphohydrolase [Thermoanaerobaculia bacterium]
MNLLHSRAFPIAQYQAALAGEEVVPRLIDRVGDLRSSPAQLSILLLDPELLGSDPFDAGESVAVLGVGLNGVSSAVGKEIFLHLPDLPDPALLANAVHRAHEYLEVAVRNHQLELELRQRSQELEELNKIGMALGSERDHEVLLSMILTKSRELSRSDAGSLYLLEDVPGEGKVLRWKLAQNDSIPVDFEEKVLPITRSSIAGYVAYTGETLVIDDAYELDAGAEYTINTSFDRETGYLTRSMLVLPMTNHQDEIIGVLQLINRKRAGSTVRLTATTVPDEVIPFDPHTIKLMRSLAGQAAVAVENQALYESIERLFEGFVTASVTAIEQRDPTTSGHSFRVADLTVELAKTVDGIDAGEFGSIRFTPEQIREIRYASLLHDFGKVGVREKVLVKEKKLYPLQIDLIRARFEFRAKQIEAEYDRRRIEHLLRHGHTGFEAFDQQITAELIRTLDELSGFYQLVVRSNEPTILPEGDFDHLVHLSEYEYLDASGAVRTLLTPDELRTLSIRKGNLDSTERGEIESHVTHTYEFLSKIPWTRDLRTVPDIAYAHHEKLNGRGYPRGLPAPEISVQSRMMTVSDIYDALTANDRPYKKAVPTERALDILRMEMADGLLDPSLVDLFIEAKIFQKAGVVRI